MSMIVEAPINRVIRRYAITPHPCNGHTVAAPCEVALRYGEDAIVTLHRDSAEAAAEALRFAKKRGFIPAGVEATVTCTRETLRRA